MSFFVFPQAWIAPAIMAAALAWGPPLDDGQVHIKYKNLPGQALGNVETINKIIIDKRPRREWPKEKAQCVIIHEYGHLAGRKHSKNPRSIMHPVLRYSVCHRWLVRHGVR